MTKITDFITMFQEQGKMLEHTSFAAHTYWRVGGAIRVMFFPDTMDAAMHAFSYLRKQEIPYKIIGKGSNLLASDQTFAGVVLNLTKIKANFEQTSETRFTIGAGYALQPLCRMLAKMGYTGHEFLSGVPGTIGGAITMNAGTPEGEVKDILVSATIVDATGAIKQLSNQELAFAYRTSLLKKQQDMLIVSGDFYFEKEQEAGFSLEKIQTAKDVRKTKQPLEYPNCGSVFRNPDGNYAGALIEAVGLKGYRLGDAQVSEKHANFIVNLGQATATDIHSIIMKIKETVLAEKGVTLETEVEYFNW